MLQVAVLSTKESLKNRTLTSQEEHTSPHRDAKSVQVEREVEGFPLRKKPAAPNQSLSTQNGEQEFIHGDQREYHPQVEKLR